MTEVDADGNCPVIARRVALWGHMVAPTCLGALSIGEGRRTCSCLGCVMWAYARRMSDAPWTPEQREWAVREIDHYTPVRDCDDLRTWSDCDLAGEVLSAWA